MHTRVTVVREIQGKEVKQEMIFGTGRLTNDPPEIFVTNSGRKLLSGKKGHNFSIAFNNGPNKDADFYPLILWENNAENLYKLGFKGQEIEIAARVQVREFEYNGEKRSVEELVVERFQVKQYKNNNNNNGNANQENKQPAEEPAGGEPIDVSDDDIPF